MKTILVAASLAFAITPPAFADDAASHAAHHPATDSSAPATLPAPPVPSGMMNKCPMMQSNNGGKMMSNGSMMQGNQQKPMGDNKMQCPMMNTAADSKPADNSDHAAHH